MDKYRVNHIGNKNLYVPCSNLNFANSVAKEESKKQPVEIREFKDSRWTTTATAKNGKIKNI